MEQEYWKIILKNSKCYGLTIPNIIGSKLYLVKNSNIDNIEELFSKIINDCSDFVLIFKYCPDIGEYVFSLGHQGYLLKGLNIKNKQTNTIKIVFAQNTAVFGNNLLEIQKKLEKKYIEKINNELFSFNKTSMHFEKFKRKEIKTMQKLTIANKELR